MSVSLARRSRPVEEPPDFPVTVADLLLRLGRIPSYRVRLRPAPGSATEADLIAANDHGNGLCELVEGTLVEKPVGYQESEIALLLAARLVPVVQQNRLGIVTGADGPLRLKSGLVRMPDVAFVSFDRLPGRKRSPEAIAAVAPDLAVEVLSKGNTKAEMKRKLREYFASGTKLVWIIDPKTRTVRAHTGPDQFDLVTEDGELDGAPVLPGLRLPVRDLFPAQA